MNCKINVKVFFLLFLVCTCCNSLCAQSAIPPFKKGERVVFVGNSITHGGHYHSFVVLHDSFPKQADNNNECRNWRGECMGY